MERGYSGTVYWLHKIALYHPESQNPDWESSHPSQGSQAPVWDSFSGNRVWEWFPGIPDSRGSPTPVWDSPYWFRIRKFRVKSSQVKSSQVKSSQVKSSQVKSSQVKSSTGSRGATLSQMMYKIDTTIFRSPTRRMQINVNTHWKCPLLKPIQDWNQSMKMNYQHWSKKYFHRAPVIAQKTSSTTWFMNGRAK